MESKIIQSELGNSGTRYFLIEVVTNQKGKNLVIKFNGTELWLSETQAKELACKLLEIFVMSELPYPKSTFSMFNLTNEQIEIFADICERLMKKSAPASDKEYLPKPTTKPPSYSPLSEVKKVNELDGLIEGRIVHVVLSDGNNGKTHCPAIITKVVDRIGVCDLTVFGASTFGVCRYFYDPFGDNFNTWHWIEGSKQEVSPMKQ